MYSPQNVKFVDHFWEHDSDDAIMDNMWVMCTLLLDEVQVKLVYLFLFICDEFKP